MTFEEFFQKKKIDLVQLELNEKELFEEFRAHYEVMGPKSFDHTKKFRFNKLRLKYPLKEEPVKKAEPSAEGAEKTAYKPMFRRPGAAPKE